MVATLALAASVTQPLFGALADRGGRLVGAAGVTVSSLLLALTGVAPSVWLLVGLMVTGGLASAAIHPAFTGRPAAARSVTYTDSSSPVLSVTVAVRFRYSVMTAG